MSDDRSRAPDAGAPKDWLVGGGEMGQRIRAFDWASTPLGPVESWPQSLRSAISILLPSKAQICLFWGPDLIKLYNDAYRPVLAAKHPLALGRPAREVWREIWDVLGPLLSGVTTTGEAFWARDHPFYLHRSGFTEETYFDVSYDPVRDETGSVGGVFCIVSETTGRVLGERRLRTLRDLGRAKEAKSPDEACRLAAEALASNPADTPFAALYLLEAGGARARLVGAAGPDHGRPSVPREIDLTTSGADAPWPVASVASTGRPAVVERLDAGGAPAPSAPRGRLLVYPIVVGAQNAGFFVAAVSRFLALEGDYRDFVDLVAGHIATAVTHASSYEQERRRAEALAELDRAKTAFFSNVSHEFRTPLTLMLGPIEDALADTAAALPPAQRDRLVVAHRNSLRLLRLVNTLLDFARLEAGRVQTVYEPTDLARLTAELASMFRSAIDRAGLGFEVRCESLPEPVYVDRQMWEKIVLNLLSNALKFTFDGFIALELRPDGDAAELRVQDTGAGIPAHELPHVFDRFHRVEGARGRTHEGSGIGLALVRELVRLHGGVVSVESAVGQGSTFRVRVPSGRAHLPADRIGASRTLPSTAIGALPFVEEALRWLPDRPAADAPEVTGRAAFEDVPAEAGGADPGERARILLADDNADMREYVRRLLEGRYAVEAVGDGQAALAALRRRPPDLLLTDVMMPGLDGFALLRAVREHPDTRSLPVIVLSARAGEESRIEGLEAGADDYVVKPFTARELLARVRTHLDLARVRREARAALERSERHFRTMADAAPVLLWRSGPDRRCAYVNTRWREFTGRRLEQEVGDGWAGGVHPDDLARWLEVHRASFDARRAFKIEYRRRRADGAYRWLLDHGVPLDEADGTFAGYIGSCVDITEMKEAERERQRALVAERRARDDAENASRAKDEFLAVLSHELRTPLNAVVGWASMLRTGRLDRDTAARALDAITRNANAQVQLIDDLLDVSRIVTGKMRLDIRSVDLQAVVESAIDAVRPAAGAKGVRLHSVLDPRAGPVTGDPARLQQIASNLLMNAVKFTPRGGHVELHLQRTDSHVEIVVSDTGEGIGPDLLPHVFERFRQADSTSSRLHAGLGLGLGLVRHLVELHGGTVAAHSAGKGLGATFTVTLPIAPVQAERGAPRARSAARATAAAAPAPSLRGLRVVVVDDDLDSLELAASILADSGAEVRTCRSAAEGLEAHARWRAHVLISDIEMPGEDGYAFIRRVRALAPARGGAAPAVALTAYGRTEERLRTLSAGYDMHVPKPVDPAELVTAVANLAGRWGAGHESSPAAPGEVAG